MKRIIVNENDKNAILSLHGKKFITEQQANNISIKKLQELLLQKGFNIVGTADDKAGDNTLKAIQAALGTSVNKQQPVNTQQQVNTPQPVTLGTGTNVSNAGNYTLDALKQSQINMSNAGTNQSTTANPQDTKDTKGSTNISDVPS